MSWMRYLLVAMTVSRSLILTELDGLNDREVIYLIGITNRLNVIDPAMFRPGRLDKLLFTKNTSLSNVDLGAIAEDNRDFAKRLWMWVKQGFWPMRSLRFDSGCKIAKSLVSLGGRPWFWRFGGPTPQTPLKLRKTKNTTQGPDRN
ncbi:hypothetical protein HOY80DRAFT_112613 [Tuber brumale]|nr:hypothetical protein HOY80DRAFT_112613 [Tuber brumale]